MNTYLGYAVAAGELAFAAVGFVTGWMSPAECMTLMAVGLSTLGIHKNNVAIGRALGGVN